MTNGTKPDRSEAVPVRRWGSRAPVLGEQAEEFARRMERITEVLGEHQNAADAGAAIQELAATADARASFVPRCAVRGGARAGQNDPSWVRQAVAQSQPSHMVTMACEMTAADTADGTAAAARSPARQSGQRAGVGTAETVRSASP